MDNPFLNGPKQTTQSWRNLRGQLTEDKSDLDHLKLVVDFWSRAPIVAPYLDWDHPNTWSDPWELVAERKFDPSAIALGMEYTLMLSEDGRWTTDRLQLSLACSANGSRQQLILLVDGSYVLNHYHGLVATLPDVAKDVVIQQRYAYINKSHVIVDGNLSRQATE